MPTRDNRSSVWPWTPKPSQGHPHSHSCSRSSRTSKEESAQTLRISEAGTFLETLIAWKFLNQNGKNAKRCYNHPHLKRSQLTLRHNSICTKQHIPHSSKLLPSHCVFIYNNFCSKCLRCFLGMQISCQCKCKYIHIYVCVGACCFCLFLIRTLLNNMMSIKVLVLIAGKTHDELHLALDITSSLTSYFPANRLLSNKFRTRPFTTEFNHPNVSKGRGKQVVMYTLCLKNLFSARLYE